MKTVTRALVVRSVDYKDSDKILTLLTPDMGKLSAGARGCRKKGSAIAAACQLLCWSELVLSDRGGKCVRWSFYELFRILLVGAIRWETKLFLLVL